MAGVVDLGAQNSHIKGRTISRKEKNPDKSDAIECSGVAICITNRLLDLTEACSDIHRSPQLLRSSELGPIDHERSATVVMI